MCYTPKYLWDTFEGGLLNTVVMGLNVGACQQKEKNKKKSAVVEYLFKYRNVSIFGSLLS